MQSEADRFASRRLRIMVRSVPLRVPPRTFGASGRSGQDRLGFRIRIATLARGSHDDHSSSVNRILLECDQSFVGLIERKRRHLRPKADLARDPKEIPGIIASHVRDTSNLALAPKQAIVIELRNPVEVNGVDGYYSSLPQTAKSRYDHIAARGERHGAVKFYGGFIFLAAYPDRPQRSRQLTVPRSSCRHVDLTTPRAQDRDGKMR